MRNNIFPCGGVTCSNYDGNDERWDVCGGENYDGARPCHYEWVKQLHDECLTHRIAFSFIETGTHFVKDGRSYFIRSKQCQAEQAYRSGLSFGHLPRFNLKTPLGFPLQPSDCYQPVYDGPHCKQCGSRRICNGCSHCGKCRRWTCLQVDEDSV